MEIEMENELQSKPLSRAKARIVLAAGTLFAEKGFKQATVRDLAQAVGIQSGSLFHHFDSKEAILAAVMAHSISVCRQKLEAVVSTAVPLRQMLDQCVLAELESVTGQGGESMVLLVSEWQHLEPDQMRLLLTMRDAYEQRWLDILGRAEAAGCLRAPAFLVRKMLIGSIGWSRYWFCSDKSWTLREVAENFVTVFWRQ